MSSSKKTKDKSSKKSKDSKKSKKEKKMSRNTSYELLNDREGNISVINQEVGHLSYTDRLDVLREVYESVGPNAIFESSDGSRFDPQVLPNDVLFRIRKLVENRSKELDITADF